MRYAISVGRNQMIRVNKGFQIEEGCDIRIRKWSIKDFKNIDGAISGIRERWGHYRKR